MTSPTPTDRILVPLDGTWIGMAAIPWLRAVATNTTITRDGVAGLPCAAEAGGLSGAPVMERSTAIVRDLVRALQGEIPVVGVGGILSGDDARAKVAAGASRYWGATATWGWARTPRRGRSARRGSRSIRERSSTSRPSARASPTTRPTSWRGAAR